MEIEYKISLDNLTVVGIPKVNADQLREELLGLGFIERFWQTPYARYNDNYLLLGGGMLQITHRNGIVDSEGFTIHQIRLEFNPNKIRITNMLEKEYLNLLSYIVEPKVTRKDLAIDLKGIDINDFTILDLGGRKRVEYKTSSMVLETLYFGSRTSDEQVRIYNKAKEQGIDKNLGIKWWRIEAQLRKEKAEMRGINPFSKIKVVIKNDYMIHDIKTRAMLQYLQTNPDGMKELSVNARTKYKRLLGQVVEMFIIDLESMYEEEKKEIQSEIESWINFCPFEPKEKFKYKGLRSCLSLEDETFFERDKNKMIEMIEGWNSPDLEDIN